MSYFTIFFGVIFLYRKMIDYANSIESKSNLKSMEVGKKRQLRYVSNGVTIEGTFFNHYLKLLELESEKEVYVDLVFNAYQKHLQYLNEDIILGYKVKTNKKELRLSHDYLVDLCDYMGNLN